MELEIKETKINKELIQTINARILWTNIKSKQEFANWIKNRLERFVENQDYIKIDNSIKLENSNLKRKQIDYFLTIDCAKMICMLENNEEGDKIRKYFIACEKSLFSSKKSRLQSIRTRYDLTDKIQELYGEKIEQNKIDGIKDWTYSNYTKLIYKKVFGISGANEVKKIYNISEKENLRDSKKLPPEKLTQIENNEYNLHCYLQVLKTLNTPVEQLYNKVKEYLFNNLLDI